MQAEQSLHNGRILNGILSRILVFFSSVLILSFGVLILSTLAGLQVANTLLRPSPFGAFDAIWPGQSIASLASYGRDTSQGSLTCLAAESPHWDYAGLDVRVAAMPYEMMALGRAIRCVDLPKDGVFRAVSVTVEDYEIRQLQLFSEVLPQDVLLLYWGVPDAVTLAGNNQHQELYWERSTFSATATVLARDLVVKSVTLTARE